MKTNVMEKNQEKKLPAGLFEGTEAFWYDNEKWLIHNGEIMRFTDAPTRIQDMVANLFLTDEPAKRYLRRIGVTAFSAAFDMWYKCKIGALDECPDFVDGNLNADAYNHACSDMNCPHRGKFCSLGPGLRNYEIKTIQALKKGETIERTAAALCVSVAGLKSRIEKMKDKLAATNMASLIARASEYGI